MIAAAQAAGYAYLFHRSGGLKLDTGRLVLIVVTLCAGTTLLMYMGEQITKRGIGNGISLLIFASILTSAPAGDPRLGRTARPVEKLFFPIVALGVVVSVVFVQEGQRRIPIQYAKRMVGRRQTGGRLDLHAAAREHGRRHPGHLRRDAARAPADGRLVRPDARRTGSTRTSRRRPGRTWSSRRS